MRKPRLRKETIQKLIEHFVAGTSGRTTAKLCTINVNTAWSWFRRFRTIIYEHIAQEHGMLDGEVEADESYFGGTRKGKRGRGAAGKTVVFGLYKRNGYVYSVSVCNAKRKTLMPILRKKVKPDSVVYTDTYPVYDILDVSEFKHERINHSKEFVQGRNHINGIENFWRQAKRHLQRYNGIPKQNFELYLKECEWRFNYRPIETLCNTLYTWCKEAGLVLF